MNVTEKTCEAKYNGVSNMLDIMLKSLDDNTNKLDTLLMFKSQVIGICVGLAFACGLIGGFSSQVISFFKPLIHLIAKTI